MLDKPWVYFFTPKLQPIHQPVTECTYWLVLVGILRRLIWLYFMASVTILLRWSNLVSDGVHPKTSLFSTRHLIWVNYKFISQLFQLIYISFLYSNSVRHFLGIELCREQFVFYSSIESQLTVFSLWIFLLFSIIHISAFISPESSRFCV